MRRCQMARTDLLLRDRELTLVHRREDIRGLLPVDLAADGKRSPKHLPHRSLELLRLALETHLAGDVEQGVLRDVAVMRDVLHLLAVTNRLLELLDEQTGRRGHQIDLRLTVLDRELHQDTDALPRHRRLHDVVTDLLWRHAQGADLRSQDGRWRRLSGNLTHVDDLHLVRVELRRHGGTTQEKSVP